MLRTMVKLVGIRESQTTIEGVEGAIVELEVRAKLGTRAEFKAKRFLISRFPLSVGAIKTINISRQVKSRLSFDVYRVKLFLPTSGFRSAGGFQLRGTIEETIRRVISSNYTPG